MDLQKNMNVISENIANLRKAKGYTQEELANAVGVSAQAVSKWECGGLPDITLVPAIAKFLDVWSDDIFGISNDIHRHGNSPFVHRIVEELYYDSGFSVSDPSMFFDSIRKFIFASMQAVFNSEDRATLSQLSDKIHITEINKENQKISVTSEYLADEGISIFSMNENLPLTFIMKQPEDPSVFEITDDMKALFTLLGTDEGAKMISNMYSETHEGQWSTKKCAEILEISEEFLIQSLPLLDKLKFIKINEVEIDGQFHKIICINTDISPYLTGLISMAVMTTRTKRWYYNYCGNRTRPYLG